MIETNGTNEDDDYQVPSWIFKNPHVQTIYGRAFRYAPKIIYQTEKINLKDDDFIDVDWSKVGSDSLAIICSGFESNSSIPYMVSCVDALNENKVDAVVFNNRGCNGEPSKKYLFSLGEANDLSQVIDHILKNYDYKNIYLVGYSIGGNLIIKYLCDKGKHLDKRIKKTYSVSPCLHLYSTMLQFDKFYNLPYIKFFLLIMLRRLWRHKQTFNRKISLWDLLNVDSAGEFYDKFCFPITKQEFKDYLDDHSAYGHLEKIAIPTLIIDSMDDPYLNPSFYPYWAANHNPNITLKLSRYGGHVGFIDFKGKYFWTERQLIKFLTS